VNKNLKYNTQQDLFRTTDMSYKSSTIFRVIAEHYMSLTYIRPTHEITSNLSNETATPTQYRAGADVIHLMHKWCNDGYSLHGFSTQNSVSFFLIYEMYTGTAPLRILSSDHPSQLAYYLTILLPYEEFTSKSLLISVLRILGNNPRLLDDRAIPLWEENRLVWFGLVWFGLVWFGLVWFGLVWFGLVWFGLVWFGLVCLLYLFNFNG
jgi:hypothetical protein